MTGSNRIEEVDISKGIGMVLVITGHLCVSASLRNFIYSFHMVCEVIFLCAIEYILCDCIQRLRRIQGTLCQPPGTKM